MTIRVKRPHKVLRLNHGRALAHPLESRYALARRLLVANPAISLIDFKPLYLKVKRTEKADRFERFLTQDYTQGAWIRQCPSCARKLFHPAIYALPGLKLCPIHHEPFLRTCPDCGNYWERPFSVKSPLCSTCGIPNWEFFGRTRLKQRDYRELRWLDHWLAERQSTRQKQCYPELIDIHKLLRAKRNTVRPLFSQPFLRHPFYAAFESQKQNGRFNERLAKLNVVTRDQPLQKRKTRLAKWEPPQAWPEDCAEYDEPVPPYLGPRSTLLTFVGLALRRILRWQRDVLGVRHTLNWYDIRLLRPEQVGERSPPCVLCLAFSMWCQAITLKLLNPRLGGQPTEHELFRFVGYSHYPNTPEGVYVSDAQGRRFRPSRSFERWLFLRSSDCAFMEFVELAQWIYTRATNKPIEFSQTRYSSSEYFPFRSGPTDLLEIKWIGKELEAVFWDHTARWRNLIPSDNALRQIHRCSAFLSCACDRVWSLHPDPQRLTGSAVQSLIDEVVPQSNLKPRLYTWVSQGPILRLDLAMTDMRVVTDH